MLLLLLLLLLTVIMTKSSGVESIIIVASSHCSCRRHHRCRRDLQHCRILVNVSVVAWDLLNSSALDGGLGPRGALGPEPRAWSLAA